MDFSKALQDYQALWGAVVGFLASQALQLWRDRVAEQRAIARESRADMRSLRDAKLSRLRPAYHRVMLAGWGLTTAVGEYIFTSRNAEQQQVWIQGVLDEAMRGINEARAELMLESDAKDVFDEFERVRVAFGTFQRGMLDRATASASGGASDVSEARRTVIDGVKRIDGLARDHLTSIEHWS